MLLAVEDMDDARRFLLRSQLPYSDLWAADTDAGLGLRGMAERATALGGRVTAGPRDEGGWRVHAVLPLGNGGGQVRHRAGGSARAAFIVLDSFRAMRSRR